MKEEKSKSNKQYNGLFDVVFLAVLVFVLRMLFERVMPMFYQVFKLHFSDFLFDLLRNYPITIFMVIADILIAHLLLKLLPYGRKGLLRSILEVAGVLVVSFVAVCILRLGQIKELPEGSIFFDNLFLFNFITGSVFNAVVITFVDIIAYSRWIHKSELAIEVGKRRRTKYQYDLLKSQLNPHFLFNSLNVLDYLIYTDQERASLYVKKLAAIYRYLLGMESRSTVTLEEEIIFVKQYMDLLRERFPKGLYFEIDIPTELMNLKVVPCSIQLLVENAVKHNIINADSPLNISILSADNSVIVCNNLQLKIKTTESTGFGLDNIRKQYKILCDAPIFVNNTGQIFEVRIPLIA